MKTVQLIRYAAAALIVAAVALAGCGKDPVTGEDLFYGSLEIINEHTNAVRAFYLNDAQNNNEMVWRSPDGISIAAGEGMIFADVPVGVWTVIMSGEELRSVPIVAGMTTTVLRNRAGNLTAGVPH
jgi:hypothetical protein